jgi:hypothetical protein
MKSREVSSNFYFYALTSLFSNWNKTLYLSFAGEHNLLPGANNPPFKYRVELGVGEHGSDDAGRAVGNDCDLAYVQKLNK